MGRRGRPVNGILLLDKPAGVTSNRALQHAKRLFDARKAGHTGSLDPLATGILPLCFGEATKVSSFLLEADKSYRVTARFGVVTDTGDSDGEPLREKNTGPLDPEAVEACAATFTGRIEQVPPMYSALKHQGRRLYDLAREGIEVERAPRPVTVYAFDLVALRDGEADFDIRCSKGTYVRTLVVDLGEALGVGAHVSALRRTALDPFSGSPDLVSIERLEGLASEANVAGVLDALLLPMDHALTGWPAVRLAEDAAFYLRRGQAIWVPKTPDSEWVRLYGAQDDFLGMGTVLADGRIAPKRLVAAAA